MFAPSKVILRQSGLRALQASECASVRAASVWAKVQQGPPVSRSQEDFGPMLLQD